MTGPKKVPKNPGKPRPMARPILRGEIEEAQRHTQSNSAAARYLNVGFARYKRYAELYGLFVSHANPHGIGIEKGFGKHANTIPLRDILAGKHPTYSRSKLRNRLVARGKLTECCNLCGFAERRITDNKIPLILVHNDGNKFNFALDNLELLCYNCCFLTSGAPQVLYRDTMKRTLEDKPIKSLKGIHQEMKKADYYDPIESAEEEAAEALLTPEDIQAIHDELMKE